MRNKRYRIILYLIIIMEELNLSEMNTDQKLNKIKELQNHMEQDSIVKIAAFLDDDEIAVRLTAIEALGELPMDESIKSILIKLTDDLDEEIRYHALESLRGYTGEDVFKAVVRHLKDDHELVRISAVEAIVDLGDTRGVEYLVKALADEEEIIRSYAAEGLGIIGTEASKPMLEKYLSYETSSLAKRGFFVGLYLLGEKKYLKSILDLLKDPDYRVRCAVANTVVDLINQENEYIVKQSLQSALQNEQTNAARSSIQGALEEINSLYDEM